MKSILNSEREEIILEVKAEKKAKKTKKVIRKKVVEVEVVEVEVVIEMIRKKIEVNLDLVKRK